MSAQVSERPTGEQPALRAETNPYPGEPVYVPVMVARTDPEAIAHALAGARALNFSQLDAARATGQRYADMQPGTPAPRGYEPFYLATMTEHYGAGPQPTFTPKLPPAPEPVPAPVPSAPGWAEGTVRGLLIAALWGTARWYGAMDGAACADCDADSGLCAWHAERQVKAVGCEKLHDCVCAALSDAAALDVVVPVLRSGRINARDLAASGSPLEGILTAALAANGGAE